VSLGLFGDLSAVTVEKLLSQSQTQLDKLQNKTTQTIADKAKIAALQAQIQVLNGGGTTAQAKQAYRDVNAKATADLKPPIIPALPDVPPAPEVDYTPYIYGGLALVAGLGILAFVLSRKKE
jgi:hypothetical protein